MLLVLLLYFAILVMFASQGQQLLDNLDLLGQLFIPILLFFVMNFIIGQKTGQLLKFTI